DPDDDRLVHRRRDDDASALLVAAALGIGLRQPRDRLAGRTLALRLDVLVALGPRKPLFLRLRPALRAAACRLLGRGRGFLRTRLLGRSLVCRRLGGLRYLRRNSFLSGLRGDGLLGRRLLGGRLGGFLG